MTTQLYTMNEDDVKNAAVEVIPTATIASSECDHSHGSNCQSTIATSEAAHRPEIKVNGVLIDEATILEEMQYHPANDQRDAMIQAAQSLIILELMRQRCSELNLLVAENDPSEERLLEALLDAEVVVPELSEAECERYYDANQERLASSPILEVDHILIAADKEDLDQRAEARELANNLLTQIKEQPHLFSDFAARHSQCPSKEQGGSLGQISKGQTVPEFERVLFRSDTGLVKSPIETRYGFHIANIHNKIEAQQLPYEAVEDKIKTYLKEKVRRKSIAQYIELLIGEADIQGFQFEVSDSPLVQ